MKTTRMLDTGGVCFFAFIRVRENANGNARAPRVRGDARVCVRGDGDGGDDGGAKIAFEAKRNLCSRKFRWAFPFQSLRGKWKNGQAFGEWIA